MDKRWAGGRGLIVLAGGLLCGFAAGLAFLLVVPGLMARGAMQTATASPALTESQVIVPVFPTVTQISMQRINPAEGNLAPDFELADLDGELISLGDSSGKVVLINFWATWCGPCRLEMPIFQDRYERYADEGFEILAVNGDSPLAEVISFQQDYELSFPILVDGNDRVQNAYRIFLFPTSFLVDREGIIRFVVYGPMDGPQLDRYLAEVGIEP
jgi:peroxiredoxin